MSKRIVNRTLSAAVVAALYASAGYAQQPPAAEKSAELETVVVTGSLIRGTPEDAALPVETFTAEDLEKQGSPSALEFVKSLTASGPTAGEAYYFSGSGTTNNVQFNLRGLGADKTLTLFNGRRAFRNSVVYPASALERIDVLKDGAAVTYGADATGGVVNMITKTKYEGFEVNANYKSYQGSEEGEWKLSGLAGFNTDYANVLFAVEWDHRSELGSEEREFSSLPYGTNPAPSSQLTNLAAWLPRGAMPVGAPTIIPGNTNNAGEWGAPIAGLSYDFNQSSCEAVNGTYVPLTAASPFNKCTYNYIPYYNLVEENDVYRVYAQVTSKISDAIDFHLRALWSRNYSPHQYGSPSQPVIRGPAISTGATYQLYVPATNPFVADFRARSGAPAAVGYTPVTYRAFAHGGNNTFAEGDNHSTPNENETKYWHITTGFSGDMNDYFGFDVGVTYNQFLSTNTAPDILGFRMQNALNGFGGPNCSAPDLDPLKPGIQNAPLAGLNGCQWYNPFASNFTSQPTLGLGNPAFLAGAQNSDELVNWLFNKRISEDTSSDLTIDAIFTGATPISLPGGDIAWGAGVQWRNTKNRESVPDPLYNGMTPCDWPGHDPADYYLPGTTTINPQFTGCTNDKAGPFLFFANNPPDATSQQQQSIFAQFDLPIFDIWNVTLAGRYEKFEPIDLDATVYKISTKVQVIDQLSFRGSYGTNYQAPSAAIIPGELTNGVNSYTRAGGAWLGAQTYTRTDIKPETATVWNVGAILQLEFGSDQDLQVTLDYFDIETKDELGLVASANDIADSIFSIPNVTPTLPRFANCAHPLIGRVTFNSTPCVQGTTNASGFSSIRTDFGNGPGQTTTGFDLQANYSFSVGSGRLSLIATGTKLETLRSTETILDGYQVKGVDDRLGFLNFATIAQAAPEWKANFSVNYAIGEHNIRVTANYVSGVKDERYIKTTDGTIDLALITPEGRQPGTTTLYGPSDYGVIGDAWMSGDVHYLWRASWGTVGASVLNVTDQDPPESRQEFGYDPRIGNPLGRQVEVSFKKNF